MKNKEIQALVEGSLFAGITVVITWLSYYIFPLVFLSSVPLVFLSYRWNLKISFLSFIVSILILSLILSPVNSFLFFAPSGILGIVLGWSIKKKYPLSKIIFLSSLICFFTELFNIFISMVFFKLPFDKALGLDLMRESIDNSFNLLKSFNLDQNYLKSLEEMYKEFFKSINIIIPSILLFSAFFQGVFNYWIVQKVFKRFGWEIPTLPSLDNLKIPQKIWRILATILIVSFILGIIPLFSKVGLYFFNNVLFVFQFLVILEGIFVSLSFLKRVFYSKIIRAIILLLIIFNPFFSFILFIIGFIDIFYPLREKFA
ncbi:MAG: hypothetical protein CBR30_02445 [Dictyoglomus sp. NZ13-RE01]|nr:MAG: hypothetical protein CBR30_02445 [Dictyoglomus sp. NZ13-RE01]